MTSGILAATRAVIFDFYGTLTIAATTAAREAGHRNVAAALGVPLDKFVLAVRQTWPERARGEFGDLRSTLRHLASLCGGAPSDAALDLASEARITEQLRHVDFRPSAVPTLRALKDKGLRIGVLSDCTHEVPMSWPTFSIAPFVDATVFSVEAGLKKPDPGIYELACRRLAVSAEDCLYVGDGDSRELPGAEAVGMRAARVLAPDHANAHVIDPITWDGLTIADLSEVPALL